MDRGRTRSRDASGFNPESKIVNMIRQVAIELREARNPLRVEKRPASAIAKVARPINGDKNIPSRALLQEKYGAIASLIFGIY